VLAVLMLAASVSPGYAQAKRKGKTGTIVKWALIGAGAGAAIGFAAGFHMYDDATFAERKIGEASVAGGAMGGAFGAMFGVARARTSASPFRQPSLWTPANTWQAFAIRDRIQPGMFVGPPPPGADVRVRR
jgi:hypothetical protein